MGDRLSIFIKRTFSNDPAVSTTHVLLRSPSALCPLVRGHKLPNLPKLKVLFANGTLPSRWEEIEALRPYNSAAHHPAQKAPSRTTSLPRSFPLGNNHLPVLVVGRSREIGAILAVFLSGKELQPAGHQTTHKYRTAASRHPERFVVVGREVNGPHRGISKACAAADIRTVGGRSLGAFGGVIVVFEELHCAGGCDAEGDEEAEEAGCIHGDEVWLSVDSLVV